MKSVVAMIPLLMICGTPTSVVAQAHETRSVSLAEAVQIATSKAPDAQLALLQVERARQEQRRALAQLLPEARLAFSDSVQRINVQTSLGTTAGLLPQHEGPFQNITAGTRFSVPVFNLSNLEHYRAQGANRAASASDADSVREQITTLVVSDYLLSIRLMHTVQASESQVNLAKTLFDQAHDQEMAGTGTGLDTLRAEQRWRSLQQALIVAREREEVSRMDLVRVLSLPPTIDLVLTDQETLFGRNSTLDSGGSIESAWQSRPEIKALEARIVAAGREVRSARSEKIPSISVDGYWYQQGNRFDNLIPTYQYQASLSVPLFTGGRIRSEAAIANLEVKRLEEEEVRLKDQIALDVKTSQLQLNSSLQELQVSDAGLELAKQEIDQAQIRFRSGVGDNIEVVTAQDALARAFDDQIASLYRVSQSRADLQRAMGRISQPFATMR